MAAALSANRIFLCFSIDSGTRETYYKIKQRDCFEVVCDNIMRYAQYGARNMAFKYICLPENMNNRDAKGALSLIKKAGLAQLHISIDSNKQPDAMTIDFIGFFQYLAESKGITVFVYHDEIAKRCPEINTVNLVDMAYQRYAHQLGVDYEFGRSST